MSYNLNNKYFGQLSGNTATRISAGSNGTGSGIKGVLSQEETYDWISANGSNNEFTVNKESIIFGFVASTNSGNDLYHRYKAIGSNLTITHGAMTNAEGAGTASKIDEDILAVCSANGTFSIECTGKYNIGYFCDEGTRIFVLRNK